MKRKNVTRNALVTSIIAMLLCVSMLVGTTFAWFTDEVTNAHNQIRSGNLDISLWHTDCTGTDWGFGYNEAKGKEVQPDTVLFLNLDGKPILWEPGAAGTETFRIKNDGSLALKYAFTIKAYDVAKTEAGHDLTEVINVSAVEFTGYNESGVPFTDTTKEGVYDDPVGHIMGDKGYTIEGHLLPGETVDYWVGLEWLPTDHDNDYNVAGGLTLDLCVELLATQYTYEVDSYNGDQYDKDAEFPEAKVYDHIVSDLAGLEAAFAEGGNILLTDDIKFEKITAIEPGAEVYLNLNGNTITVDENTSSNTLMYVKEGGKLTIDGNGTIDLGSVSTMAIFAPYGELVIENGTFIRDEVTTVTNKTTGLFMGAKTSGCNVTINGGYFDAGYYDKNADGIEEILAGTKEFTETADDIAKRGNSKDANLVRTAIKDNVSALLNHAGYGSFKIYGGTFVGANPAWGDEGCMLPTTPNYLRPWSYYQGSMLDGQVFHEDGIVLPAGYTITRSVNAEDVPVYTVNYSK